jgi:hypothetical protein
MKFHKQIDATKAAHELSAAGLIVESVRKDYGAQRELTWQVHLANGGSVHNTDQLKEMGIMADKTYSQINTEIEQHVSALEKLELEVAKHRGELRILLDERSTIEWRLGVFALNSTKRTPRVSSTPTASATSQRERNKVIRAWAADQGMKVPPRRIPNDIKEAFERANPGA